MKICIKGQGHVTKMAAMARNSIKQLKIFSGNRKTMILKLGMKYPAMKLYIVYVNHDPGMTFPLFYGKVNLGRISQISGERL